MTDRRILVRGGTLVSPEGDRTADVLIEGERIRAVGAGLDGTGAEVIDAYRAHVIPGAIDAHTHFDLPIGAVSSADDFETGTIAAACGGTTCVLDFAGAGREPPEEALAAWHRKADDSAAVDYGFHLTLTSVPEDAEEANRLFASFAARGITSVKLYMAYPDRLMVDDATLGRAIAAGAATGVRVCVHAEDGDEVERLTREAVSGGERRPRALRRTRPPSVEAAAVTRAARLAGGAGPNASVYIVHLSSAAGLRAVRQARAQGLPVLVETCPQYLFLTGDRLEGPDQEAAPFVCAPPLREDEDRAALWESLGCGDLQVVATDHCPFTQADRARGVAARDGGWRDFREIPGGLPGVETRLSLIYQGVLNGTLTLARWVDAVSAAPARLFGLSHRKGALEPGMDADVVVFDPQATKRLDASRLHMRTDHSPYQGLEVKGWPAVTISRGRVVARDGEPEDVDPGWGRFVSRRPV